MQIKFILAAIMLAVMPGMALAQTTDEMSPEELQVAYEEYAAEVMAGLIPLHGMQKLTKAPITLNIPKEFDFYAAKDAQTILEDIWGNPPDDTVSGMLFPAGMSPSDADSWGAALTYEKIGYVTDDDASTTDYDELLSTLQKQTRDSNAYLEDEGYATVDLIGWAVDPRYDPVSHKVYWAKDLLFSNANGLHTLNYDMRVLGRGGVLSINFIANMSDLPVIERAAPAVLAIPTFNEGQTYADYVEGDKTAGYGVAALVAGGAGLAVLKKGGLLVILLAFLKKGWIVLLIAGGAIAKFGRRLFGGAREE